MAEYAYRITKYDPRFRSADGAYTRDEWHLFSHVGQTFADGRLTLAEYERVEATYIRVAQRVLSETRVSGLCAVGVENSGENRGAPLEGSHVSVDDLEAYARGVLREEYWCRFESETAYLHFGWDFYMYIGVASEPRLALQTATRDGLFVERMASPYSNSDVCG